MPALRVDGVIGRLGDAPNLRFTPSGAAVASVSIVFQESYKDNTGTWVDKEPVWVNATGWRELAESMAQGLNKGDEVMVSGVLTLRKYEKNGGGEGQSLDLNISNIGPTMRRQEVQVRRVTREQGGDSQAVSPNDDPWSQPHDSRNQNQPRETRQEAGRWMGSGQQVARPGGFTDEPPF